MIKPTNGRVVLFTPGPDFNGVQHDAAQPLTAHIVHVWNDRLVNVAVFDSNGWPFQVTSVTLLQDDDATPGLGRYCEWMAYQKGQAAKTEQLEQKLKSA